MFASLCISRGHHTKSNLNSAQPSSECSPGGSSALAPWSCESASAYISERIAFCTSLSYHWIVRSMGTFVRIRRSSSDIQSFRHEMRLGGLRKKRPPNVTLLLLAALVELSRARSRVGRHFVVAEYPFSHRPWCSSSGSGESSGIVGLVFAVWTQRGLADR